MLKKLFYIGLGFSIVAVKKSVSYFREGKEWAGEQIKNVKNTDSAKEDSRTSSEVILSKVKEPAVPAGTDDLTKINGIGPTYAKRLKDAGVTTYQALLDKTPEELRTLTKAAGKSADTESWISQARDLT
ncbi:MAG: helix-hairpin-helix domain-containing protein [Candidatus Promineifilaceae bacterium]|jgi:predicted flap endonuclease-1-like 5' DNA nuclease